MKYQSFQPKNIPGGEINRGEFGCLKTHVSSLFRTLIPWWLKRKKGMASRVSSKRISTIPIILENAATTSAQQTQKQAGKTERLPAEKADNQEGLVEIKQVTGNAEVAFQPVVKVGTPLKWSTLLSLLHLHMKAKQK